MASTAYNRVSFWALLCEVQGPSRLSSCTNTKPAPAPGGKLHPFVNLPIGQHRQEGAAEQLVVAGIAAQRGAVIRRRRRGVALTTRVPSGEIAARGRGPRKAIARLRLGASGEHSRPSYGECSQCGHSRTPQGWRRDHGSSTPSDGRTPWRGHVEQNGLLDPARNNCPDRACPPPLKASIRAAS